MSILNNIHKTKLDKSSFILDDNRKYLYLDLQKISLNSKGLNYQMG